MRQSYRLPDPGGPHPRVAPSGIQVGQPGDCAPWAVVDWSAPANGRGRSQDRALGGGDPPAR